MFKHLGDFLILTVPLREPLYFYAMITSHVHPFFLLFLFLFSSRAQKSTTTNTQATFSYVSSGIGNKMKKMKVIKTKTHLFKNIYKSTGSGSDVRTKNRNIREPEAETQKKEKPISFRVENDESNKLVKEQQAKQAKHMFLSIAASVLQIPPDVLTQPPMIEPTLFPETRKRKYKNGTGNEIVNEYKRRVNEILARGWNGISGFQTPKAEEVFVKKSMGCVTNNENKNQDEQDSDDENQDVSSISSSNSSSSSSSSSFCDIDSDSDTSTDTNNPFTYGEVTVLGARQLFKYMKMTSTDGEGGKRINFVDLGSGSGKLVSQAFLEIPFINRATGIELSHTRHMQSIEACENVQEDVHDLRTFARQNELGLHCSTEGNDYDGSRNNGCFWDENAVLEFIEGDLFELNLCGANANSSQHEGYYTHIFVASLCFTNQMMQKLGEKIVHENNLQTDKKYKIQYVATLKKFPTKFGIVFGNPKVYSIETSWTKPLGRGCNVYIYSLLE